MACSRYWLQRADRLPEATQPRKTREPNRTPSTPFLPVVRFCIVLDLTVPIRSRGRSAGSSATASSFTVVVDRRPVRIGQPVDSAFRQHVAWVSLFSSNRRDLFYPSRSVGLLVRPCRSPELRVAETLSTT